MNKEQFISKLNLSLRGFPTLDRKDVIRDFNKHFTNGLEDGKTEEEISNSFGSPQQIAKELLAVYHVEKADTSATTGNIIRALWAVIGLRLFNLVIVLGPFIAIVTIIIAGWILGISFIASPLLLFIDLFKSSGSFVWFDMFPSLLLSGLGFIIIGTMIYVTRFLTNQFIQYLKYNLSLVIGDFNQ